MARTNSLTNYLTDVATAIKTKKGDNTPILASDFDTEIANLPSGGGTMQTKEITITTNTTTTIEPDTGYDGLSQVSVITNIKPIMVDGLQFQNSSITSVPDIIANADWSQMTTALSIFKGCRNLETANIPSIATNNITNFTTMFQNCSSLQTISYIDISHSINKLQNMFSGCSSLSNTSLDIILQMCINATSYTGTKTLSNMGLSSTYYSTSTIQALTHYQDFINAGWTIGY